MDRLNRRSGSSALAALVARAASVALALIATVFVACSASEERSKVAIEIAPISALALAATQDAEAMGQHALAMVSALGTRPELALWGADAETVRADARSLRLLESTASAIRHDPGARSGEFTELIRLVGDGRNLEQLEATLIARAGAMDAHATAMRQQAAGDPSLTSVVGQLSTDTASMRRNGQAAIDRGKELQETARRLAQSLGQKIE